MDTDAPTSSSQPRFSLIRPARPMLARDADSIYWMARYVERAEHVARVLLVNSGLLMDVGDLTPSMQQKMWMGVLQIFRVGELPDGNDPIGHRVGAYMTHNRDNPVSILNCLTRARENARGIREAISAEMWESLNTLYWSIEDAPARFEESPDDVYRQTMNASMLFQGLTDQTLGHGQRWLFTQVAKYLERIDVTCQIISTKFAMLKSIEAKLEMPLRNIHWMSLLRSCCSIEAYRRNYFGDMESMRIAGFLILEPQFPRSIRYCLHQAHDAVTAVRATVERAGVDPAERILGRLEAQLEYAELSEIIKDGVVPYLQRIQEQIAEAGSAVQRTYFLH